MRIAHFTDLHLRQHLPGTSAIGRRRSRDALRLFTAAIESAIERAADVIVVTGDLVDVPLYLFEPERNSAEDKTLWEAARSDYAIIRDLLNDSGLPWVAIPGNHDSHRLVAEVLGQTSEHRDIGGIRFVSFWDREVHHNRPQRILSERRRFDQVLSDAASPPQVHLQHYVISPVLDDDYPHTYLEGTELRERLAAAEHVSLVLSGHYHPGATPTRHGKVLFSVTPALTETPHAYRLFTLGDDHRVSGWEEIAVEPSPTTKPAVFLDRDGCINTLPAYSGGPEDMELIPGAASAIQRLRDAGYLVVVITNQTCIGLGYATPMVVDEVHDRMSELLAAENAAIDAIYYSADAGARAIAPQWNRMETAKPSPSMLREAAGELNIDLSRSWMIGDRWTDIEAGNRAGTRSVLVRTGAGRESLKTGTSTAGFDIADDLEAAARFILRGATDSQAGFAHSSE